MEPEHVHHCFAERHARDTLADAPFTKLSRTDAKDFVALSELHPNTLDAVWIGEHFDRSLLRFANADMAVVSNQQVVRFGCIHELLQLRANVELITHIDVHLSLGLAHVVHDAIEELAHLLLVESHIPEASGDTRTNEQHGDRRDPEPLVLNRARLLVYAPALVGHLLLKRDAVTPKVTRILHTHSAIGVVEFGH